MHTKLYMYNTFKSNVKTDAQSLLSLDKGLKIQLSVTYIADKGMKLT